MILGSSDVDIIVGGPGDDVMDGGTAFDLCSGGPQVVADTALNCEFVADVP